MRPLGALRDQRGMTMVEIAVAALIGTVVFLGMGFLYVSSQRALEWGSSQAYLQRTGTLVQERLEALTRPARAVQVAACGPGTPSLMFQTNDPLDATSPPPLKFYCLYQFQDTGDNFPKLYLCEIPTFTLSAACINGTRQNVLRLVGSETLAALGTELHIQNLTFTDVRYAGVTCSAGSFCVPTSACFCAGAPSVDVRFDLRDHPETLPMRFGFNITVRNY